jgi:ribonucleoside-diphosphate reductase beta chain
MHRLLEDRSPETFTRAHTHYHLVVEGILAQTGYCGMQRSFSADEFPDLPHLEGLRAGFSILVCTRVTPGERAAAGTGRVF